MKVILVFLLVACSCMSLNGQVQSERKPIVWIIDNVEEGYGDFYNPFMETMKSLRLGNRLRVVSDFKDVKDPRDNDIWLLLSGTEGFHFSLIGGYWKCGSSDCGDHPLFCVSTTGGCCGGRLSACLKEAGYSTGNRAVGFVNDTWGN